jgi:FkbM family methyltransferase
VNWTLSVALSRWRNRLTYVLRAPFAYRNWWAMVLPKLGYDTTLVLRGGTRYFVRAGTTDLSVVNELAFVDPYLGPGYVTIPTDATVVDIGANIGDFSVQAAVRCPQGRVVAIEPVADIGRMIDVQARLNGLTNVTWLPVAVGGREGEMSSGELSALYRGSGDPWTVKVTTLPAVLAAQGISRVHLLKMDCEGAEWDILPAAEPVLPNIDQICLEFHCERGWTPEKLAAWLRERGYTVAHTAGPWNGLLWAWRPGPDRS